MNVYLDNAATTPMLPEVVEAVQNQCRSIQGQRHLPNLRLSVINRRQPPRSRPQDSINGKAHTSGTPRVGLPEHMSMMVSTLRVRPAVVLDVLQDSHACHHQQVEATPHWTIMVHKCSVPDPPHLRTHPPQESNLDTNSSSAQISTSLMLPSSHRGCANVHPTSASPLRRNPHRPDLLHQRSPSTHSQPLPNSEPEMYPDHVPNSEPEMNSDPVPMS